MELGKSTDLKILIYKENSLVPNVHSHLNCSSYGFLHKLLMIAGFYYLNDQLRFDYVIRLWIQH